MKIRPDIQEFVYKLGVYAGRKLNYPSEISELLQIVAQTAMVNEFEELLFQAKFLLKTQEVMKRVGPSADGFEKLSREFQSGVQKSVDLLRILADRAPAEVTKKFSDAFLVPATDSFNRLINLLSDLSWLKNWKLDGKPLPYDEKLSNRLSTQKKMIPQLSDKKEEEKWNKLLSQVKRCAGLAVVLFILTLLIDPPVTILGWILSLGIVVLLVYIVLQVHFVKPN